MEIINKEEQWATRRATRTGDEIQLIQFNCDFLKNMNSLGMLNFHVMREVLKLQHRSLHNIREEEMMLHL